MEVVLCHWQSSYSVDRSLYSHVNFHGMACTVFGFAGGGDIVARDALSLYHTVGLIARACLCRGTFLRCTAAFCHFSGGNLFFGHVGFLFNLLYKKQIFLF
jgi:hypothetical protein